MDHIRDCLRVHYAETDDPLARALADEPQNFPGTPEIFNGIDPQRRKAIVQQLRAAAQRLDPPKRDELLAAAVATIADRCMQQGRQASNSFGNLGKDWSTLMGWLNYGPHGR